MACRNDTFHTFHTPRRRRRYAINARVVNVRAARAKDTPGVALTDTLISPTPPGLTWPAMPVASVAAPTPADATEATGRPPIQSLAAAGA